MSLQLNFFDYNQLDSETRIVVQQRTSEIKALMKRTAQDIIEIGEKLAEVRGKLVHNKAGGFEAWLEAEFDWNLRTAYRFMNVANKFNLDNLSKLDIGASALYLLAAPSTPDEARAEAISRAEAGERITHQAARGIVADHRNGHNEPDNRPLFANDPHLDAAIEDQNELQDRYCKYCYETHSDWDYGESGLIVCQRCLHAGQSVDKPVCLECGQVYDGPNCPDCQQPSSILQSEIDRPFNYKRDSRQILDQDVYSPKGMDACQTPAYALDPILVYLSKFTTIWEPAAGEGYIVEALYDAGWSEGNVRQSDILTGQNFFEYKPDHWDCLVTNPPFSLKFKWLERSYELGKPFALLLPVETLGTKTAQDLFKEYGMELVLLDKRVNFKMPNKGWESNAQFPVAWFTWGLGIGETLLNDYYVTKAVYASLDPRISD